MGSTMRLTKEQAFELAAKVADMADHRSHKLGAVILDSQKRLVSVGHNSYRTHPLQKKFNPNPDKIHLHAEIMALSRLSREDQPHSIFVVRVKKGGGLGNAKPCKGCQAALSAFGVDSIYWS